MTSPGFNVFLFQPLTSEFAVGLNVERDRHVRIGPEERGHCSHYRDLPGSIDRPIMVREQRTRGHECHDDTPCKG
jgi:hypothetical protein